MSLFVTLIAANMTMVAQARLSFRDIDPYVSNQEFSLVFSDNILVRRIARLITLLYIAVDSTRITQR